MLILDNWLNFIYLFCGKFLEICLFCHASGTVKITSPMWVSREGVEYRIWKSIRENVNVQESLSSVFKLPPTLRYNVRGGCWRVVVARCKIVRGAKSTAGGKINYPVKVASREMWGCNAGDEPRSKEMAPGKLVSKGDTSVPHTERGVFCFTKGVEEWDASYR